MHPSKIIAAIVLAVGILFLSVDLEELYARGGGGRGGGGGRPGGGARPSGGAARPGGGGGARPPAGGGARPGGSGGARPGGGAPINRSPGVSAPSIQRPSLQPGSGGGPGARGGPGIVTSPRVSPGTRPSVGVGTRPNIDGKLGPGQGGIGKGDIGKGDIGKGGIGQGNIGKGGIGKGGVDPKFGVGDRPGAGQRPATLPGLGSIGAGLAAGKAADIVGRRQELGQNRQQNVADRSQNLQDRLGQRQDFRQENRQERQDYRNDRREDWQNWHDDYYGHHNGWYHGAWCDHWGDNWSHMWSEHTAAMVLGTTMWGLNRMSYWFGTSNYANPYYSEPVVVGDATISYAEPLAAPPVSEGGRAAAPAELPPGVTPEGMKQFEAAQTAFMAGDYQQALTSVNKALASMPQDAVMHEFRALALFALGKYREAAETLHPVLAVGPGWDWTTMTSLYPDVDTYTNHLRALETFAKSNPNAASARFVLAYHYLILGHDDEAAKQLRHVQQLVPADSVSAQLLQMMGKAAAKPESAAESEVKIDAAAMVGVWTASRGDKARFELTLGKDKAFSWVYREGKHEQKVEGAYAIDGTVLALEPDAGGVMLAELSTPQNGAFEFKTVGAPKTDPTLKFQRK